MSQPTIVVANLDDTKLKESIDNMVKNLDNQLLNMMQSTDTAVKYMQKSLQSVGDIKFGSSGSDGGSSKRTKKQHEEAEAVKQTADAYDNLAQSQQKASKKKGIEYISLPSDVQESLTYLINVNKNVDTQLDSILQKEQAIIAAKEKEAQASRDIAAAQSQQTGVSGSSLGWGNVHEMTVNSRKILEQGNAIKEQNISYSTLEKTISQYLGVSEQELQLEIRKNGSYAALSVSLKKMVAAYQEMTQSERESSAGRELISNIQRVQRAVQQTQAQMSRPVSLKAALGLDQKSLDDIAYKMQMLRNYRSSLDFRTIKGREEIEQVNKALEKLRLEQNRILGQNKDMMSANNALTRSFNYMKNRLAFYFTVGASTQFIKNLIEIRSQYEMNERALGILINSAERGSQIFKELSEMALVSPYTLIELSAAAKQLTAYDVAAKDVVDTTRRLADMASAVGVPIERLTYALGQIKAYGYLNSRDARMFANAGIPLVKQLSDYYTELEGKMVSTADVYDRMKKKAIDYNSVMSVITKMTDDGGKFFNFQAKMADTLKVRLANLTLAWNNMMNEIGSSNQGILTTTIGLLKEMFKHWKDIDSAIHVVMWTVGFAKLAQIIQIATIGVGALGKQIAWNVIVGKKLSAVIFGLVRGFKSLIASPATWFALVAMAATSATLAIVNMNEAQKELNKSLREGAKEEHENLSRFLKEREDIRNSLSKKIVGADGKESVIPQNIEQGEARKVWESIREQIELTTDSSEAYISALLRIENVSERARRGFDLLDSIKAVDAAIKELDDDTIKVDADWSDWWNLFLLPDGWKDNLVQYEEELNNVKNKWGDVDKAVAKWKSNKLGDAKLNEDIVDMNFELARLRENLDTTMSSIIKFIEGKGWGGDTAKINEVFSKIGKKITSDASLTPEQGFLFQMEWERGRSQAAKRSLEIRIADENKALAAAADASSKLEVESRLKALNEEYANFEANNGRGKVLWENYTKWMKEQHMSEMREMFRGMSAEEIKKINFGEKKWQDFIKRTATQFSKEHRLAYNDVFTLLRDWVTKADKWSIFIPLTISTTDDKSLYQQLGEYDKAADEAWKTMQRLDKRISQLRNKGAHKIENENALSFDSSRVSDDDKELTKAIREREQAQKDYNDAVSKGGESKKENTASTKAQHEAETELQKALKDELQLIEKVRSTYKTLTKEGMNHLDAITAATNGYEESVANVNNVLRKYGLELDLSKFAGIENPHGLVVMLQKQLDTLFGKAKPAEIQALQVKIKDIKVDAAAFDQKTFATSLNDQLGKLKDEYELAIALDADPELGESFASLIGLNLDSLPRTVNEYAKRANDYLNEYMTKNKTGIQLPSVELTNQQLEDLKDMVDTNVLNAEVYERIKKVVNEIREARKKEMEEHIRDWNKLIEKYSEYETKIKNIQNITAKERRELVRTFGNEAQQANAVQLETQIRAENDPAAKQALIKQLGDLANQVSQGNPVAVKLNAAIDNKDREELAKASFEEFQKTPEWLLATGDLAYMTRDAIGYLIDKINDYKKTAKYLDPKQIKQMNNALKSLYKEQRKNNPFEVLIQAIDQAKENAALFDDKIDDTKDKIKETEKEIAQAEKYGFDTTQLKEQLDSLKNALTELENAKDSFNSIDPSVIVEGINGAIAVAQKATEVFTDMMNALGGKNGSGDAEAIGQMFSILEKAGTYASIGASIGGGYGAAIGGILGAVSSVVTMFSDEWSGNASITRAVQRSERAVKRLELSYIDLKHAMDEAYGTAEIGAQRAIVVNKELQLAELKRQLQLEQSRKSKNRDADRILELRKQIRELEYDIVDSINEITNSLLGISSVGNAAETLVTNMIAAFKKGEDFMAEYAQTFDDMIDNMIMKAIVSQVIGQRIQELFDKIQQTAEERAATQKKAYENAYKEFERSENWADKLGESAEYYNFDPYADKVFGDKNKLISREEWEELWKKRLEFLKKQYEAAMTPTPEDVQGVRDDMKNWRDSVKEEFMAYMDAFGIKYGQDSTKQLSALQQGISQISEVTAQSLEAYANSISQQAYLRNDLLTQIRDVILGFDVDIQTATLGQILLQLQNSYQVQMSIQNMLEGALNPSGRAFMVELNS